MVVKFWRGSILQKCKNPMCNHLTDNPSGYCCIECKINHETVYLNPRKSQQYYERKAIAKVKRRVK